MTNRRPVALVALAVVALIALGAVTWLRATDEADVLLVGDSIIRQTGPALSEELPDREVENRGVNGSGLLNPQVYDWVERLPGLLAQTRPESTVVLFIGNYAVEEEWWIGSDGEPVPPNTPEFFSEWREQSELVVDRLEASGTDIYWVLPPPVASEEGNETIAGLRQVYRELAEDHPDITLIDAAPSLTDGTGTFVWEAQAETGAPVPLRAGDGVHLSDAGARQMAAQIAAAIREGNP